MTGATPNTPNTMYTRQGGCLCRAVRFTAHGEPVRTMVCHCHACQRITGSTSYAESLYPLDAVQFTGEMARYAHTSENSGKQVYVHFCPRCGSTLGLSFERWPEFRVVSRGAFDEPDSLPITSHIWTDSAQTGVVLPAGVDCFAQARATLAGEALAPQRFDAPRLARGDA